MGNRGLTWFGKSFHSFEMMRWGEIATSTKQLRGQVTTETNQMHTHPLRPDSTNTQLD